MMFGLYGRLDLGNRSYHLFPSIGFCNAVFASLSAWVLISSGHIAMNSSKRLGFPAYKALVASSNPGRFPAMAVMNLRVASCD